MRIWIKLWLSFLLVTPAFLVGGVHVITHAVFGGLACLLAVFWSLHLRRHPERHQNLHVDGWFWLFVAAIGVTALQLIPLPLSWLGKLSSQTSQVITNMFAGVGLSSPSTWQPLSLAPPETSAKLIRDLGCLLVFFVTLQWAHQRNRVRWLMRVAVLAAAAMAGLILVQAVLGIKAPLWGLYHPRGGKYMNPVTMSPFINPNHMGAYFLFHGLLSLPLLIEAEERKERLLWSAILLVVSVLVVLSLSRGAVATYVLGLLAFAGLLWRRSRKQLAEEEADRDSSTSSRSSRKRSSTQRRLSKRQRTNMNLIGVAVLVAIGLTVALSVTNFSQHISRTRISLNQDKVGFIYNHSRPFLKDFPLLGVGRGAMPMAWHRYSNFKDLQQGQVMITHVESNVVQPLIDWGLPFGILFVVTAFVLLGLLIIRSKGFLEQSILIAILALLLQNVGDFNLEFMGTGFPFLIMLAALVRLQQGRRKSTLIPRPWLVTTMGVSALAMIVWLTPFAHYHQFFKLPQRWAKVEKAPPKTFNTKLQKLVRSHPSDYMLAIYMARRHSFKKPWRPLVALQWLKRGSYLNPIAPEFMMLRAYNLARLRLGDQAIQELDKAIQLRSRLVHPAIALLQKFNLVPLALRRSKQHALVQTIHAKQSNVSPRPPNYESSLRNSIKRYPQDLLLHRLLAYHLLGKWKRALYKARRALQQPNADKEAVMLKAVTAKTSFLQSLKKLPTTDKAKHFRTLLYAHVAREEGQDKIAEKHYRSLFSQQQGNHWMAFVSLFRLLIKRKAHEEARVILNQAQQWYRSGNLRSRAHIMYLEGRLLEAQGRLRYALRRYESAWNVHPNHQYQEAQAKTCWNMGQSKCTLRIYQTLYQTTKKKRFQQAFQSYQQKLIQQRKKGTLLPKP